MKLAEFNRIVNPNDEACYIIETPQGRIDNSPFKDVKTMIVARNDIALKMYVPKGLLIIELENEIVVDAIARRQEHLMVAKKHDKYYIYAMSSFNKNTTNNMLACGASANTLVHTKKGTEILLPFHSSNNVLPKYATTEIVYSNGIGPLPLWLMPIRNGSSPVKDGLDIPIRGNAAKILSDQALSIASFTRDQQRELIRIMNEYLTVPPLDQTAIDEVCDSMSENFMAEFMNKNEFYHDKFGDYVIRALNIHKDETSKIVYFYDAKKNIYTDNPDYLRGYITKLCPRLKQYQKDEVVKYISDVLEMDAVKFNSNPFNIVFKNGILHLDDMTFEPMSPEFLETIQINANYNPNAHSDTADEFFHNVTCGDDACKQLLFESIGYAMLKTVELAKSFMVTGTGRNGKSTFFDLITAILGEKNCAALAPHALSNNFRSSTLVGKLASIAADISGKPLSDTDTLKNIAAGDRVQVEKKFKDAVEDRLFSTLFFACNKIPKTPDTSPGFYRRWVIIPFNADLTKIKNVEGFAFKKALLSQESIDYVAYKSVQAIYNLFNTTKEFIEPLSVKLMKEAYMIANSSVLSWFKETYVHNHMNPTLEERAVAIEKIRSKPLGSVYGNYTEWCRETNKQALSRPNFEEEVKLQFDIEWLDMSTD